MMKKVLLAAIVLLISVFALCASEADVTWVWFENDPNVQYYRYQIDGEDDDSWTIVDFLVNEVTVTLDVSVPHTLYLQQSYDGVSWSESSMVRSEVFTGFDAPETETGIVEEPEIPAESEDSYVPEETGGQEEAEAAAAEEILPVPEKYIPLRALDYGFGYLNSIPDSAEPKTLGLFASYSRSLRDVGIFRIGFIKRR